LRFYADTLSSWGDLKKRKFSYAKGVVLKVSGRSRRTGQTTALQADALARAAVDVVFEEEASGATPRPVLAALKSGDTLRSRCGGSIGSAGLMPNVLRERRFFLRLMTEGFDTSTASGRLLYHVLGAVAEFECEVIV
jgi:DNA invertase Pin-like site-specific DNA recombinase